MGVPERSEGQVRRLLSRAVAIRWPGERLLFTTSCRTERLAGRWEWFLGLLGKMHCPGGACAQDTSHHRGDAILGVTQSRLVYRERGRHSVLLWVVTTLVAASAIVGLMLGNYGAFVTAGTVAFALWLAAEASELYGVGSGAVGFSDIRAIDHGRQMIEGAGRWGTRYLVRIPDPQDFRLILALTAQRGPSAA